MSTSNFSKCCRFEYRLQDWCINLIVRDFDVYMRAYGNSTIPDHHFEFLQRAYSETLFDKLMTRSGGKFCGHYMSFVMNRHLKEIDFSCYNGNPQSFISRLRSIGEHVRSLNLSHRPWSNTMLEKIVSLIPNIEVLQLSATKCNDHVLQTAGQLCPRISTLDLSYCVNITDEGIRGFLGIDDKGIIRKNTSLQSVDLTFTDVSRSAVSILLDHAPMLRELHSEHAAQVVSDLRANSHMDYDRLVASPKTLLLTNLKLYYPYSQYPPQKLTDILTACQVHCPFVTSLTVDGELNQTVVDACARFEMLQQVQLSNISSTLPSSCLRGFLKARGQRLRSLYLENFTIPMDALKDHCRNLDVLGLLGVVFDGDLTTEKNCFPCLRELGIEDLILFSAAVVIPVISLVYNCPKLEKLSLPCNRYFSMDVAILLSECPCMACLHTIDVSRSEIRANSVKKIVDAARGLKKLLLLETLISEKEYLDLTRSCDLCCLNIIWSSYAGSSIHSSDEDEDFEDFQHFYNDDE